MLFMVIVLGFLLQIKTLFRTIFSQSMRIEFRIATKLKVSFFSAKKQVYISGRVVSEPKAIGCISDTTPDVNIVNSTCDTNGCKHSHSSKILEIWMRKCCILISDVISLRSSTKGLRLHHRILVVSF